MLTKMIDTHCHLYAEEFDTDRDEMIVRATEAGVTHFLLPNIDLESIDALYRLADTCPDSCLPMMGLHPCSVGADYKKVLDKIYHELQSRRFIGIGEIGLDYYWDLTYKAAQADAFKTQLGWARELNLPVAIHTRNSFADAFEMAAGLKNESLNGVFHCFSGTAEDAAAVAGIDFYMGIGGVLTFKNGGLDKIMPGIPMHKVILETDAPYLAPAPHRGKRNEPAYLALVAQKMAELTGMTRPEVEAITTENAVKLFKLFP